MPQRSRNEEHLHGTISIILDGLDFNLPSSHCCDAQMLRKIGRFYELLHVELLTHENDRGAMFLQTV
jgi:hypothetical protein